MYVNGLRKWRGSNRTFKRTEPLLDTLYVIIIPTAGLAALQQALQHSLLIRREKQHQGRLAHLRTNRMVHQQNA